MDGAKTSAQRRCWFRLGLSLALGLGVASFAADTQPSRLQAPLPPGWKRGTEPVSGAPLFTAPGENAGVTLLPSTPFAGTAEQWRDEAWRRLAEQAKLVGSPQSGVQGEFLTRMGGFSQHDGSRPWMCLYTRVNDGRGEGALFATTTDKEFFAHLATVNAMIQRTTVAASTPPNPPGPPPPRNPEAVRAVALTLDDYLFAPPDGWQTQRRADHILLTQNSAGDGCIIQLLPPQPSSGDLERDARAVFDLMYAGWRHQKSGPQQSTLSKGILPSGLNYCFLEASMSATTADGRYHLEDGAALVVQAGDRIGIVAVRHRGLLAHSDCHRQYGKWRRFFNSLGLRGAPAAGADPTSAAERIVGRWTMTESAASAEYVFAANGNYAFVGALGSTSTSSDARYEYLHIKTYAFRGDGAYSISGKQLTLTKRGAREPERLVFRFEQVNHGGTGWNDRLYLLSRGPSGENEVSYERAVK